MCVCEGRTQCIPTPTPDIYSKYKNKEYTNTIILNKKDKKHIPKKMRKKKYEEKPHQFCTSK